MKDTREPAARATAPSPGRATTLVLAIGCGVAVANLYYSQPLLVRMAEDLDVPKSGMGIVSALSQAGYAIGLLFFVPLGDTLERRRLILFMLGAVTCALLAVAVSPNILWLAGASLVLGVTTITPQLIIPLAASMAGPAARGRVVGSVMSGLLIGILVSRTASGFVGAHLGWRAMYWIAAGLMLILEGAFIVLLPRSQPASHLPYPRLLWSLGGLLREEPVLRESCLFGAAAFGAFSAFRTTLAFLLAGSPYRLGSDAVGLFGLVGVAGALAAPLAGRLADAQSPRLMIGLGLGIMLLAFLLLALFGHMLAGLIVGVVLLDLGAQSSHISNQARIYSLRPEAHNRLNTVYMVSFFLGGSAGSALGTLGWSQWGWSGVCVVGVGLLLLGFAAFLGTRSARLVPGRVSRA